MKRRKFIKATGGILAAAGIAPFALSSQEEPYFDNEKLQERLDQIKQTHACISLLNSVDTNWAKKGDMVWVYAEAARRDNGQVLFSHHLAHVTEIRTGYYEYNGFSYNLPVAIVKPVQEGVDMEGWEEAGYRVLKSNYNG